MKDTTLIQQARNTHYTEWFKIRDLMTLTTDKEELYELNSIMASKYREEEMRM